MTYIASTPEKVWDALRAPEMTKDYWGRHRNASDYDDPDIVDLVGTVVDNSPPHRLVLTWAFPTDAADPEKHSRVTFSVEPFMDAVRLTVTHEGLEADSPMLHGISQGWPVVLSSLKTLMETGQALPITTKRWSGLPK